MQEFYSTSLEKAPFFPVFRWTDARYSIPCLRCGAQPGSRCNSNGVSSRYIHKQRTLEPEKEPAPIPAAVEWWRSMRAYEGSRPAKRPPNLEVPSQAELAGVEA